MIVTWSKRLLERLTNKRYRAAYVEENVRTGIAFQIRTLRGEMSQADFGKKLGKPQSVVSRLEDPDYGKLSVQTLLEVAAALDIALLVKFASFPDFIQQTRDVSPAGLSVPAYDPNSFVAVNKSVTVVNWHAPQQRGIGSIGKRFQYNPQQKNLAATNYFLEINRGRQLH